MIRRVNAVHHISMVIDSGIANIKIKYVAIFRLAMAVGGCQKPTDKIEQPDNGNGLKISPSLRGCHIDKGTINMDNG